MAMERQRRMDKTLGCLVASMTFGALILYYIQPELPVTHAETRFLIAEPNVWHAIHIDPEPVIPGAPSNPAHFYVDAVGVCAETGLWEAQKGLPIDSNGQGPAGGEAGDQGRVIRIGLITPRGSNLVSADQHACTRSLVTHLGRRFAISPESIIWDDTLEIPAPQPTSSDIRPEAATSR
jgi:hypothetical protein